jgi:hypothetical protein
MEHVLAAAEFRSRVLEAGNLEPFGERLQQDGIVTDPRPDHGHGAVVDQCTETGLH